MRLAFVLLTLAWPARFAAAQNTLGSTGFAYLGFQLANPGNLTLGKDGFTDRLTPRQKLTIQQITSIFEAGEPEFQYGSISDIDDGGGLGVGRAGFTGEEILLLVSRFSTAKHGDTPLATYLPCLEWIKAHNAYTDYSCLYPTMIKDYPTQYREKMYEHAFRDDFGTISKIDFGKAWVDAANDPVMRQVQDQYQDENYFEPSVMTAKELGLKTPLGYACVYDANIQMDTQPLFAAIQQDFAQDKAREGRDKPASLAEEIEWIRIYLKERRAKLKPKPGGEDTTGRVDSLEQILDSGNLQLQLPLNFTYDGQSFSIGL
jgi:hypothetical protein